MAAVVERWAPERATQIATEELVALYASVGWTALSSDGPGLARAVAQSLTYTVRSDGRLVGLVRVVTDGQSVALVQDLLVHPSAQRRGVGTALVRAVFRELAQVRQKIVLADESPGVRRFFDRLGMLDTRFLRRTPMSCFVRYEDGAVG